MKWLQHAFAVNPPTPEPTAEQMALVDRLCREVVRRRMTAPALAFLEMSRPLNFLGAQALHFLAPIISSVASTDQHRQFAEFLERRDAVEILCRRIEEIEAESKPAPSVDDNNPADAGDSQAAS